MKKNLTPDEERALFSLLAGGTLLALFLIVQLIRLVERWWLRNGDAFLRGCVYTLKVMAIVALVATVVYYAGGWLLRQRRHRMRTRLPDWPFVQLATAATSARTNGLALLNRLEDMLAFVQEKHTKDLAIYDEAMQQTDKTNIHLQVVSKRLDGQVADLFVLENNIDTVLREVNVLGSIAEGAEATVQRYQQFGEIGTGRKATCDEYTSRVKDIADDLQEWADGSLTDPFVSYRISLEDLASPDPPHAEPPAEDPGIDYERIY